MPVQVTCPKCGASGRVKEDKAGKRVRCSTCGAGIRLPGPGSAAARGETAPGAQGDANPALDTPRRWRPLAVLAAVAVMAAVGLLILLGSRGHITPPEERPGTPWWDVAAEQRAYAAQANLPAHFENGQGQRLVLIPPGTFTMGSPETEPGRLDQEGPQHQVEIAHGYYMAATEVTNAQYRRYEPGHSSNLMQRFGKPVTREGFDGDAQPVVLVSWNDAVAYCDWLTKQERAAGSLLDGHAYRLPTEAEWEYACRAGTVTAYSFGSDPNQRGAYAWYGDNSGDRTHAVGLKHPNGWGLFDMHGNALEWSQSLRRPFPYRARDGRESLVEQGRRIIRGGGYGRPDPRRPRPYTYDRSATRVNQPQEQGGMGTGFRVVLSAAPWS